MHDELIEFEVLKEIILEDHSCQIASRAIEVKALRSQIENRITDEDKNYLSSIIKHRVQKEAEQSFVSNAGFGSALMATGTGKSKLAINLCRRLVDKWGSEIEILLVVPTQKLRDTGWKNEFNKWGEGDLYDKNLTTACYASLRKFKGKAIKFVILDEGHNITEKNSLFFKENDIDSILLLTATDPENLVKKRIIKQLGLKPVYRLSLDTAIDLGLLPPYEITVIKMPLDGVDKYIKAGSKKKVFYQTEAQKNAYLNKLFIMNPSEGIAIMRADFIRNLRSKTETAKKILEHIIPKDLRTLIFAGSINQARQVCDRRYYSKPQKKISAQTKKNPTEASVRKDLELEKIYEDLMSTYEGDQGLIDFIEHNINRLSCVEALNEGHNLPMLDVGFIIQLNSKQLDLIQRIGRLLRYRPNYIGRIIILVAEGTQDESWAYSALAGFDRSKITWITLEELRTMQYQIKF